MHRCMMPIIARIYSFACMNTKPARRISPVEEMELGCYLLIAPALFYDLRYFIKPNSISTRKVHTRSETCQTQQMTSITALARLRLSKGITYLPLSTKAASLQTLWSLRNTATRAVVSKRSGEGVSKRKVSPIRWVGP